MPRCTHTKARPSSSARYGGCGQGEGYLCAGEADAAARHLQVEARLGVLLPPQGRIIAPLLPVQPVDAHVPNSQQDSGVAGKNVHTLTRPL